VEPDPRFWDKIADSYSKKPFPDPAATARRMETVRGLCRPHSAILDVGCGTGTLLLSLAPHIGSGEGVDLSPAMIAIAQAKATEAGVRHVAFRAAPAGGLEDVADRRFDGVMAFNVLHLVPDPATLVQAAFRVLAPGGWFVSTTACLGGIWLPPYPLMLPVLQWIGKAPPVVLLDRAGLVSIVEQAGFSPVQVVDVGASSQNVFVVAKKPAAG
jgi:SAM-dependent methyltransferase